MIGEFDVAEAAASEGLALAMRGDSKALTAEAYNRLGVIALLRDQIATAHSCFDAAIARSADALSPLEYGHISMNRGTIARQQGDTDAAERSYKHALDCYSRAGDLVARLKAQANLADLLRCRGEIDEALALLLEAREVFVQAGAQYDLGLVKNEIGCVYLSRRKWEPALDVLHAAVAICDRIGAVGGAAVALSNIGELYVTTEQWDEAVPALDAAHALAVRAERPLVAAAVDVDRERMLAAQGATDPVRQTRQWMARYGVDA